jgi:hypothetical protein
MTLLQFHVAISLIGIATGLIAMFSLLAGRAPGAWTAVFLATTVLTSITGFPLPPFGFDPPRAIGVLSLVLLAVAVAALYAFGLRGRWRWIYIATAMTALYLNVFVGVVQAFGKIGRLHALAPTQTEAPFLVTQLAVLVLFAAFAVIAIVRFHPAPAST